MSTIKQSSLYTDLTVEECSEINGGAPFVDVAALAYFGPYLGAELLVGGPGAVGRALVDTYNKAFHSNMSFATPISPTVGW